MLDYLNKYKKLLEQKEINEQEIKENQLLIDENLQKWQDETDKELDLYSEIKLLFEKYDEKIEEKENKLRDKLGLILFIIFIMSIIILSTFNPLVIAITPLIAIYNLGILKLIPIILKKFRSNLKNKYEKDGDIIVLLEQIKTKEKELSKTKESLEKYSKEIIKYRSKIKQLQEKQNWYDESINELMINYAQPIFEEQLKNNQEEVEQKDNQQPKTKTRKQ
jgi:hypothetical protein